MRRSAQCSPFLSLEPRVDCIRFGITDFEFREGLVFGFENEDSLLGDDRRRHGQDAGPQSVKPVTADCPRALRVRRTPPVVSMPGFRTRGSLETTSIFWISNKKKGNYQFCFGYVGWVGARRGLANQCRPNPITSWLIETQGSVVPSNPSVLRFQFSFTLGIIGSRRGGVASVRGQT